MLSSTPPTQQKGSICLLCSFSSSTLRCIVECVEATKRFSPSTSSRKKNAVGGKGPIQEPNRNTLVPPGIDSSVGITVACVYLERVMSAVQNPSNLIIRDIEKEEEIYNRTRQKMCKESPITIVDRKRKPSDASPLDDEIDADQFDEDTPNPQSFVATSFGIKTRMLLKRKLPSLRCNNNFMESELEDAPDKISSFHRYSSFVYSKIFRQNWLQALLDRTTTDSGSALKPHLHLFITCLMLAIKYLDDRPRSLKFYLNCLQFIHKENPSDCAVPLSSKELIICEHACITALDFDLSVSNEEYQTIQNLVLDANIFKFEEAKK